MQKANIDKNNEKLYTYDWPGNVRELRNLVERITILANNESKEDTSKLLADILSKTQNFNDSEIGIKTSYSAPLKEAREQFEKEYLITQLKKIMAISQKQQT